jgi:hypothetical protein
VAARGIITVVMELLAVLVVAVLIRAAETARRL